MPDTQIIRVTPLEWCIAMHESWGALPPLGPGGALTAKRKAFKREEGFLRAYVDPALPEDEREFRCYSYGCWQMMGQVLRELGYDGPIDRFAASADVQIAFMRAEWRRKLKTLRRLIHRDPEEWRLVEAHNKGAAGAARLKGPTAKYHGKVMALRSHLPPVGEDGLVEMLTVEKAAPLRR